MGNIQDLTPEIQKRISDFEHFLSKDRCTDYQTAFFNKPTAAQTVT